MTQPPAPLERFSEQAGRPLSTIVAARALTAQRLTERRRNLEGLAHDSDAGVVLLGSWGRHELTSGSDDDFVILVHGERRDDAEVRPSQAEVAAVLARDPVGSRKPGREGTFGKAVFSRELIDNIGLQRESNEILTQRVLLMLESEWASNAAAHTAARRAVLEGYLDDRIKDFRPPRFLLNEVVRYWRTIGVDFVAKMRTRDGEGWGLRNAKLRTSRKLLFASGLVPALRCHEHEAAGMLDFLAGQYSLPPLDRLADAFLHYGAEEHGASTLMAYDCFLGMLDDESTREELEAITDGAAAARSTRFDTVARLGLEIDRGLLGLLFCPALARWTRQFAIL